MTKNILSRHFLSGLLWHRKNLVMPLFPWEFAIYLHGQSRHNAPAIGLEATLERVPKLKRKNDSSGKVRKDRTHPL